MPDSLREASSYMYASGRCGEEMLRVLFGGYSVVELTRLRFLQ